MDLKKENTKDELSPPLRAETPPSVTPTGVTPPSEAKPDLQSSVDTDESDKDEQNNDALSLNQGEEAFYSGESLDNKKCNNNDATVVAAAVAKAKPTGGDTCTGAATTATANTSGTATAGRSGGTVSAAPSTTKTTAPTTVTGDINENNSNATRVERGAMMPSTAPIELCYSVKWIHFCGRLTSIVMQNDNGPCPLLAIINILMLKHLRSDVILDLEKNREDAMATFDKLQTGLDINVKFTGITDFEYTNECIVFDLLNLRLCHGWLFETDEERLAIGKQSYNQLIEMIINGKSSDNNEQVRHALIAENFLNRCASQLTYHGITELFSLLREKELCVLFRNNHFSTMYKSKDELFILITDQGFLPETSVIWETLSNVEGDSHFVNENFQKQNTNTHQVDEDYRIALKLSESEMNTSDYELAKSLQFEEDSRIGNVNIQPDSSSTSVSNMQKKKSNCTIL